MITVASFRLRFPQFSDSVEYPDERIQLYIDDSVLFMGDDESRWCGKYDLAQSYLVAHMLYNSTLLEAGGTIGTGMVTSKSAGGVSVSRASNAMATNAADSLLQGTPYGMQFLAIRDTCPTVGFAIFVANCY